MTQPEITIYTRIFCPFCQRALGLLNHKKLAYHEIKVNGDQTLRTQMNERANGANTFPQIFIGKRHIGGCDELLHMQSTGELDRYLENFANSQIK